MSHRLCSSHQLFSALVQVTALDFTKEKEPSLHNATLLGGLAKSAAPLLLGAAPEGAAAAAGSLPLPQELLHTEVKSMSMHLTGTAAISMLRINYQHVACTCRKELSVELHSGMKLCMLPAFAAAAAAADSVVHMQHCFLQLTQPAELLSAHGTC
jgi:hypothetical protein